MITDNASIMVFTVERIAITCLGLVMKPYCMYFSSTSVVVFLAHLVSRAAMPLVTLFSKETCIPEKTSKDRHTVYTFYGGTSFCCSNRNIFEMTATLPLLRGISISLEDALTDDDNILDRLDYPQEQNNLCAYLLFHKSDVEAWYASTSA